MSATSKKDQNQKDSKTSETEADVLYQKIGNVWYAFSVVDDEVFMGAVPSNQIFPHTPDKSNGQ